MAGDAIRRNINIVMGALVGVNFLMLVFLTTLVSVSTQRIVDRYRARPFLESLRHLPAPPGQVQLTVVLCFVLLIGLLALQILRLGHSPTASALLFVAELLLCVGIMYLLGFNYKGILFMPAAGVIASAQDNRRRGLYIGTVVVLYIILDFDIVSARYPLNALNDYILQYDSSTRFVLYALRNILAGLGEMLFVLFMVLTIHYESRQAERFKDLYAQISRYAEELKITNLQLEEYSLQSERNALTRERNRMAREIHDVLGHTLTGISAAVDASISLLDRDPGRVREQLVRVSEVARNGLDEVRRSVHALRPDALERFSLGTALRRMTGDINEMTNTKILLDYPEQGIAFTDECKALVYRLVQESITNSVRHGSASEIAIHAGVADGFAHIRIRDNGSGCAEIREGFGLGHIRDGVETLGGQISFSGQDGFETTVTLPVKKEAR